jgi:hypothetical protein
MRLLTAPSLPLPAAARRAACACPQSQAPPPTHAHMHARAHAHARAARPWASQLALQTSSPFPAAAVVDHWVFEHPLRPQTSNRWRLAARLAIPQPKS